VKPPQRRMIAASCLALTAVLLSGCALPSLRDRPASSAFQDTGQTQLARALAPSLTEHRNLSGVHALPVATDAFAARARLAAAAERSIDAQYYMWHGDVTGKLLLEALVEAAGRGVRVRLLLDDNNTAGMDGTIAALAAHPNVQVRLFNPLILRHVRWTNYLFDFERINHRMHNKSFTVDNEVTVIGGRNIGDEYFDAGAAVQFVDLDLMAVGPIVGAVSKMFDEFWNSASAYPAPMLVGSQSPAKAARALQDAFASAHADPRSAPYLTMLKARPLIEEVRERKLEFQWSEARLVADDPAKVFSDSRSLILLPQLLKDTGTPHAKFDLVSPYFVLMQEGTRDFEALAHEGVRVRVLTNSLASNDVVAVHAGYAKHRRALLDAGIQLYELKRIDPSERRRAGGSSAGSLHAKTLQIDDSSLFVGSFNFDPRSVRLNTEMGVVIQNHAMAQELGAYFDSGLVQRAYEVRVSADGQRLEWIDTTAQGTKVLDTEPGAGFWRRALVKLLSVLPVDWLL
jgi:putative cardiolipin synthase